MRVWRVWRALRTPQGKSIYVDEQGFVQPKPRENDGNRYHRKVY